MNINRKIKSLNTAEQIAIVNILLFIVGYSVVSLGLISQEQLNQWVGMPQKWDVFLTKPWTIFTYAFFHARWQHLFWNMLFLYLVGQIFFNLFNNKQFLKVYLSGIFFGGICFLSVYFLPSVFFENTILLGASGAIIAMLFFVCVMAPTYVVNVFFSIRMRLWYVALLLLAFDIIQFASDPGGKIVHIGGAFIGCFLALLGKYPLQLKRNNYKKLTKKQISSKAINPSESRSKLSESQKIKQHKVNVILEKISSSGYTSLTEEEKKFLFEASKEMNL